MNILTETITVDEVEKLVAGIASRDQRTTSPEDATAWWTDLNRARIGYRDAAEAASHYYVDVWPRQNLRTRFRLTAPVLIELVRKTRADRLAEANVAYVPGHPYETGAESAARLRAQLTAAADGQPIPAPARILSGRTDLPALIAGLANAKCYPTEIAEMLARARPTGAAITCPVPGCHAKPNTKCLVVGTSKKMRALHPKRIDAWATLIEGCPECRVQAGDGCRELGKPYPHGTHASRIAAAKSAAVLATRPDPNGA